MSTIEFTDRYQAAGISYPDVSTMCEGQCEGTGFYPHHPAPDIEHASDVSEYDTLGWEAEHSKPHERCDGWHFIKCPACGGTGKRREAA